MVDLTHLRRLASALGKLFAPTPNDLLPTSCPRRYETKPNLDPDIVARHGGPTGPGSSDAGGGLCI